MLESKSHPSYIQFKIIYFYFFTKYAGHFGFFPAFSAITRAMCTFLGTVLASGKMHRRMLYSIMRRPLSFFDITPRGRIISRFSFDVDVCDLALPMMVKVWPNQFFRVCEAKFNFFFRHANTTDNPLVIIIFLASCTLLLLLHELK
jgi:ABC-type multidrug transport system fused ATPase/permease subunit